MTDTKNSVPINYEINDIRMSNQFKGESFSKYKKTDVHAQLITNMSKGKIEPACYWAAELVCSGHYIDLWESILKFVGKHIHLGNPKIVVYLESRYAVFRTIMQQGHFTNELQLRNNITIRRLFAEIICTLTYSNRKHSFETIKINRAEEFDITQMTERLKADSMKYAEPVFLKEDPKELFIAINEFAYHTSMERSNMLNASYWIEWVIEFDLICKKRKEPIYGDRRTNYDVDVKLQKDIIWIVWDCLLYSCKQRKNAFIEKVLNSILTLFCIKYTTGACKKRRYLLYFAVALLTEPVPTNIEICSKKEKVHLVVDKINEIYKQIKKNEESPGTDYLFSNLEKEANFENTIRKLEMIESMGVLPRNEN